MHKTSRRKLAQAVQGPDGVECFVVLCVAASGDLALCTGALVLFTSMLCVQCVVCCVLPMTAGVPVHRTTTGFWGCGLWLLWLFALKPLCCRTSSCAVRQPAWAQLVEARAGCVVDCSPFERIMCVENMHTQLQSYCINSCIHSCSHAVFVVVLGVLFAELLTHYRLRWCCLTVTPAGPSCADNRILRYSRCAMLTRLKSCMGSVLPG